MEKREKCVPVPQTEPNVDNIKRVRATLHIKAPNPADYVYVNHFSRVNTGWPAGLGLVMKWWRCRDTGSVRVVNIRV